MLSFGRVQEITVYISSGITNISKLSVLFCFFSSVVHVRGKLAFKQNKGCSLSHVNCTGAAIASHLYHLCFAPSQLFSFTRLTSDLAEAEHLF